MLRDRDLGSKTISAHLTAVGVFMLKASSSFRDQFLKEIAMFSMQLNS